MNEKEIYYMKRRRKRISQMEVAKAIGASQALVSRYELGDCNMSDKKIRLYREYIDKK